MSLRILVWAPRGSSYDVYWGPGSAASALYAARCPERDGLRTTLLDGLSDSARLRPGWDEHESIGCLEGSVSARAQAQFVVRGMRWFRSNFLRFDVAHGLTGFDLTVRPLLQRRRIPTVIKLAGEGSDLVSKGRFAKLGGLAASRIALLDSADAVIATSERLRSEAISVGLQAARIAVIPNGVDQVRFRPPEVWEVKAARERLGVPQNRLVLAFVGAVVSRKRPHLLVDAIGSSDELRSRWTLVAAGPLDRDPEYVRHLQASAAQHNVDLVLNGYIDDVRTVLHAADLYSLPSRAEGFPNSLLEAMACGLPALVTPASGIEDIVRNRVNGWMVSPDALSIAAALEECSSRPDLRATYGSAGLETIGERYSAVAMLKRHSDLFDAIRS